MKLTWDWKKKELCLVKKVDVQSRLDPIYVSKRDCLCTTSLETVEKMLSERKILQRVIEIKPNPERGEGY